MILSITNPSEIIKYLTYYSPIILIIGVVSLSFIFQNFKGIFYLGVLLLIVLLREMLYKFFETFFIALNTGAIPSKDCTSVIYSTFAPSNASFSAFIFAFTIMYIFLPMFINNNINVWMLVGLTIYFIIDTFIKNNKKCVARSNAVLNILVGFILAIGLVVGMNQNPGLSNLLFFNDYSSNKEICTMSKKQTFKCSVYKNGELIGSSTT